MKGIYHSTFVSIVQTWLVDSGATSHMTPNMSSFTMYMPFPKHQSVKFGNGAYGSAHGIGTVPLQLFHGVLTMTEVLFVPSLVASLLSVKHCMKNGCSVLLCAETQKVKMHTSTKTICGAVPSHGLLVLRTENLENEHTANLALYPRVFRWQKSLGHLGFDCLAKMASNGLFRGNGPKPIAFVQAKDTPCDTCIERKHTTNPHPSRTTKATDICERIHTDMTFFDAVSRTGHLGFVSFLDEAPGKPLVRFIKKKD